MSRAEADSMRKVFVPSLGTKIVLNGGGDG